VIGCITTLPALILLFDGAIEKTRHRSLIPKADKLAGFVTQHSWVFLIVFVVVMIPALYGYTHTKVYYDLTESLPEDLDCIIANTKLQEDFDMNSTHMLLVDADMPAKDAQSMLAEIEKVDGVRTALGMDSVVGVSVPEEVLPESDGMTLYGVVKPYADLSRLSQVLVITEFSGQGEAVE